MRKHVLVWGITCVSLSACSELTWMDESIARERRLRDQREDAAKSWVEIGASSGQVTVADAERADSTISEASAAEVSEPSGRPPLDALVQETMASDSTSSWDADAETIAACDPNDGPEGTGAIFVAKGTPGGTGTRDHPVSSVAAALVQAVATHAHTIFVDADTFEEDSLTIAADLEIRGGFRRTAEGWKRICAGSPSAQPTLAIRAGDNTRANVGLRITAGNVWLDQLTVRTSDGQTLDTGEGQSTYAIWASGRETILRLTEVHVFAGNGGDGDAVIAVNAAPLATCTGTTDCATSEASAGKPGAQGAQGANGRAGQFASDGFRPYPATAGQVGGAGTNGSPGAQGATETCVSTCDIVDRNSCECRKNASVHAAASGTCGCGGTGGDAGREGHSGGASVAVLVTDNANLVLDHAELTAADGGAGTKGSEGQGGLPGTMGHAGPGQECFANCAPPQACTTTAICTPATSRTLAGGAAGSAGGAGGRGGNGGAGFGGPTHALVMQHSAVVLGLEGSQMAVGKGGSGGAVGLTGASSPQLVAP